MKLTFLPERAEWEGSPGKSLMEIAAEAGVSIDGNCAGKGTCGKCKVKIVSVPVPEPCEEDSKNLTKEEIRQGYRLACRLMPQADMQVETLLSESAVHRKVQLTHLWDGDQLKPAIIKKFISVDKPTLGDHRSHAARIMELCGSNVTRIGPSLIKQIPDFLEKGVELSAVIRGDEIIHLENGDEAKECYGVAFDIGTTTIVGFLWNLATGERVQAIAKTNPQGIYGADVISRIQFAGESEESLQKIQRAALDCLADITESMAKDAKVKKEHIYSAVMVGNTTMMHLIAGVDPSDLARAPFTPVFSEPVCGEAVHLGLPVNENAQFLLVPGIAGHVGADITAGLLVADLAGRDEPAILLDVGTNGEIVMAAKGHTVACSTAAGPAFEGASITHGIRATAGAIEKVFIENDDVTIATIDGAEPIGLCGSGIIDAAAELLKAGIVDASGRMADGEKMRKKGFSENLIKRMQKGENGLEFVLAWREGADDITITQKDLREIQLAKAAIDAGIQVMMKKLEISLEDIEKIMIAGAFGSHIRTSSAMIIGLIPRVEIEKVTSIGNAAGTGASLILLSEEKQAEARRIVKEIEHLELSAYPDFQEEYLKAMRF